MKTSNKGSLLGVLYLFLFIITLFIFAFDPKIQMMATNILSFVYVVILCIVIETDNDR